MAFIIKKNIVSSEPTNEVVFQSPEKLLHFASQNGIATQPLDIESLIKKLNIQIIREEGDESFSGCIEKRTDGYFIIVNKYHHPRRIRFTLAHELAHYFLHRNQLDLIGREEILMRESRALSKVEREANDFAAALLMPQDKFFSALSSGHNSTSTLADFFQVSIPAVKYRAMELGLIKEY